MKSKFIATFLLSIILFGQLPQQYNNFSQAQKIAIEQNKKILLVMKTQYCPFCKRLLESTFEVPKVKNLIQNSYILVVIDKDLQRGQYPNIYDVPSVPVTFIINPHNKEILSEVIGAQSASYFVDELSHE